MSDSDSSLSSLEDSTLKKRKKVSLSRSKKKPKKPRTGVSLFEDEVEEGSDEESDVDKEAGYDATVKEISRHELETQRRYDERHRAQQAFNEMSEQDIARELEEKHNRMSSSRFGRSGVGDASLSRNANLPTITDPKLYAVRCKPGQEQLLVVRLMNRCIGDRKGLSILSAVSPGTKGYVYVEAYAESAVKKSLYGLRDVFQRLTLIPLKQMTSVMTVTSSHKTATKITPKKGMFARMRKFPYKGDICQIISLEASVPNRILVKFLPRIDYDLHALHDEEQKRLRIAQKIIPARGLLKPGVFQSERGVRSTIGDYMDYVPELESYFLKGLLVEEISPRMLDLKNVNPTLEELADFDVFENERTMALLQETKKKESATAHTFVVGDMIIVRKGELKGVTGKIIEIKSNLKKSQKVVDKEEEDDFIENDLEPEKNDFGDEAAIIKIKAFNEEIKNEILEFGSSHVQKLFSIGNHVKILSGDNAGETGTIVEINEATGASVVFSDISKIEIKASVNDLKLSNETSTGQDSILDYKMFDFVKLVNGNVGVILRISTDSVTVLDSNSRVAKQAVNSILSKIKITARTQSSLSALDKLNNHIKLSDKVKILVGKYRGLEGTVRYISRNIVFLFSRQIMENSGMLCTFSKSLSLIGGSVARQAAVHQYSHGRSSSGRGGGGGGRRSMGFQDRDRGEYLKGKSVKITRGKFKGYVGIVIDVRDKMVKVELHTKNRTVTIDKDKIKTLEKRSSNNRQSYRSDRSSYRSDASFVNAPPTPLYSEESKKIDESNYSNNVNSIPTPGPSGLSMQTPALTTQNMQTPGFNFQTATMSTPGFNMQQIKTPALTVQGIKTPGLHIQGSTEALKQPFANGARVIFLKGDREGQKGTVQACDGNEVFVNMEADGQIAIISAGELKLE